MVRRGRPPTESPAEAIVRSAWEGQEDAALSYGDVRAHVRKLRPEAKEPTVNQTTRRGLKTLLRKHLISGGRGRPYRLAGMYGRTDAFRLDLAIDYMVAAAPGLLRRGRHRYAETSVLRSSVLLGIDFDDLGSLDQERIRVAEAGLDDLYRHLARWAKEPLVVCLLPGPVGRASPDLWAVESGRSRRRRDRIVSGATLQRLARKATRRGLDGPRLRRRAEAYLGRARRPFAALRCGRCDQGLELELLATRRRVCGQCTVRRALERRTRGLALTTLERRCNLPKATTRAALEALKRKGDVRVRPAGRGRPPRFALRDPALERSLSHPD